MLSISDPQSWSELVDRDLISVEFSVILSENAIAGVILEYEVD